MSTIVFGGSFDPVHVGHLKIAQFARKAVQAKRVVFLPSSLPFFAKKSYQASAHDRVAMLECALAKFHWADLCLYEVKEELAGHPSIQHFMIDTIRLLKEQRIISSHPYLLLGSDQVEDFEKWKDAALLAQEVKLLVATRNTQQKVSLPYELEYLDNPPICCASSTIKELIQSHQKYKHLLPREVARYIEDHKLY